MTLKYHHFHYICASFNLFRRPMEAEEGPREAMAGPRDLRIPLGRFNQGFLSQNVPNMVKMYNNCQNNTNNCQKVVNIAKHKKNVKQNL